MKALDQFRKVVDARQAAIDAKIAKKSNTTLDTTNWSATEIQNLTLVSAAPIQNADGTFVNMPGYDY